jgi:hypothetical protein
MNFVITDFPREVYLQFLDDIPYLVNKILWKKFSKIGRILEMKFHVVHGKVNRYQLFVVFQELLIPETELCEFKCRIMLTAQRNPEYILHFQPFKNLEIGNTCLFDIPYTSKSMEKFTECFEPVEGSTLRERLDEFVKEQKLTHKPWLGKIVELRRNEIYVELEDETIERISLDEGQQFQNITCEGLPVYKM